MHKKLSLADMDKDFDDLFDGPKQAPARPSRFAPKGAKPKPKTKPKASSSSASMSLPELKKEEVDEKPEMKPKLENSAASMDVDLNPGVEKVEGPDDSMEIEVAEVEVQTGDEDEVVREIDVYFSPSVDPETQLYLFQYPLRPQWRPYELDDRCEEVRVKPTSAEVEVDLAIDVDSKNFDAGADPRVQMKKQTLAPSWKPPQTSGCTVGVLTGNKLHLNPIHAVVQLRPSMRHLDEKESKKKTGVRNGVEDVVVKSEEHQEAKPSGILKKQKALEQTKDSGDSGEAWVPLKYHSMRSDMAVGYLQKMIAREGSQIYFSTSSHDYLNGLCPGTSGDSLSSIATPRRSLLALPLKERFKTWLLEGPPLHRFDTLKYLAPDESIEEVLAVLQEVAVLVQGLWVAKTVLVYETDNGISAKDRTIRMSARDRVLLLFSKNVLINIKKLPPQPNHANAMKDVLRVLATERPGLKDWKLKELPDFNFIKLYPAIVKKQQKVWETIEKKFDALESGGRNGHGMKTSKSSTPTNLEVSKGSDKLAARTSGGSTSTNVMSDEVRDLIRNALQRLFKIKICSFQQISQNLRAVALHEYAKGFGKELVAAANNIDAFPDQLQEILSEVAVNIHGICIPRSSPSTDLRKYDDIRNVIIDLFLAQGPNARLKRAAIMEAAKMKLKKDIDQVGYDKVLRELCRTQNSSWILKSS